MEATLLLYSGRPNPRWSVPPDQAEAICEALDALPVAAGGGGVGGLGYAGVGLRFADDDGRYHGWTIGGGLAASEGKWFVDEGRRVERALLASGRQSVPEIASLGLVGSGT